MNILCVDQFSNIGGGQRSLLDLLPAFSARGWQPYVAMPGEGPFSEAVRNLGYETNSLDSSEYASMRKPPRQIVKYACEFPRLACAIKSMLHTRKIDLIYVNGPRVLPPTALAARRCGIPIVFHCHSRLLQQSALLLAGACLRFSRAQVIGCCRYAYEPLRRYVDRRRVHIIYNGVDGFSGAPRFSGKLRRIGVIGRIEPEKGQMEFVRAARLVVREFPECQLSMIGAPMFSSANYYNDVVAASRGLPMAFTGWQDDISSVFSRLDLLVVPSTAVEATTRVILEAFAAGVPVVAFPSGGIPEIVNDGETGFLATDFTPQALARRIISVLRMAPAEINAVVLRAKQCWRSKYTLNSYQQRVCDVLAEAGQGSQRNTIGQTCPSGVPLALAD
jgi:glycosyltransferase involved in cell wall biosynthesis